MDHSKDAALYASVWTRRFLRLGAVATIAVWLLLAVFGVLIGFRILTGVPSGVTLLVVFFALLASETILVFAGFASKCPCCSNLVLVNSWMDAHPRAHRAPIIGYKVLVVDILMKDGYRCFHCGRCVSLQRSDK